MSIKSNMTFATSASILENKHFARFVTCYEPTRQAHIKKKSFVDYDNNNLRKTFSSQLLLLYILGTFLSHLEVVHICSIRRWPTNIWLQTWWNQSTELIFRLKTKTRDKNRMILRQTSEMLDDNRRVDRAQRRQQRRCQRAPGLCWHFSGTKVHFCFKSSKFFPSFLFSDNFVVTLFINRHWSYIVGHFMKIQQWWCPKGTFWMMSFAWREKTDFIKDMPPSFSLLPTRSFYFPFPLARQDYEPKSLWRQVFDLDLPLTAILHWSPSARPVWHSEWRRKKKI